MSVSKNNESNLDLIPSIYRAKLKRGKFRRNKKDPSKANKVRKLTENKLQTQTTHDLNGSVFVTENNKE